MLIREVNEMQELRVFMDLAPVTTQVITALSRNQQSVLICVDEVDADRTVQYELLPWLLYESND